MFERKKADALTAKKGTEDPVFKRQKGLRCVNETRSQAAQALTKAAEETKIAFHKEVDRIIKEFDPELRTVLGKSECRQTNVSRTYIIDGNPELLEKFQQISEKHGIINIEAEKSMSKIHVRFEIAE
jgi:hypothetical protein